MAKEKTSNCWTVNSKNQILVTQRDYSKKAGGLWEFTGGGVVSGEAPRCSAKREIKEELGIDCGEISLFATIPYKKYFMDVFLHRMDIEIDELSLQEGEVIDAKWIAFDEVKKMIESEMFVYSAGKRFEENIDKLKESLKESGPKGQYADGMYCVPKENGILMG